MEHRRNTASSGGDVTSCHARRIPSSRASEKACRGIPQTSGRARIQPLRYRRNFYFYRQFGYEYALPLLEETKIRLEQIPDYKSNLTFRPFIGEDIPRAIQLLEESHKKFYVHAIRDQQIWKMQHETGITGADKFEGRVVEKGGSLIAYFRISSDLENKTLIPREVSDADWYTNNAILKFLKDYGKQHGLGVLMTQISYVTSTPSLNSWFLLVQLNVCPLMHGKFA